MMACILSMCVVGSFAAWLAGNVILGGFSLFLTFFIGVRFLVKPDTQRKDVVSKGEKLDFKGVLISAVLRIDHRLWNWICGDWRRHDDAYSVHFVSGNGAQNSGGN